MLLGERLKNARNARGLTQSEVATVLGVKNTTISNWENNTSKPDADFIGPICGVLKISPNDLFDCPHIDLALSPAEKEHIQKYRRLDTYGQDIVNSVIDIELKQLSEFRMTLEREIAAASADPEPKHKRKVALFDLPVSAGRGAYLDDHMTFKTLELDEDLIPPSTSYAVRVSGDSMEPDFNDGDILLVHETSSVDKGELGIFILNGEGYFKEFGDGCLISYNDKYDDIPVHDFDSFYTKGKVVGAVEL